MWEWLLQRGQLERESCNEMVSFGKPHPAKWQQTCSVVCSFHGGQLLLPFSCVGAWNTRLHSSNMANTKTEPCLKMIALGDSRCGTALGSFHSQKNQHCACGGPCCRGAVWERPPFSAGMCKADAATTLLPLVSCHP